MYTISTHYSTAILKWHFDKGEIRNATFKFNFLIESLVFRIVCRFYTTCYKVCIKPYQSITYKNQYYSHSTLSEQGQFNHDQGLSTKPYEGAKRGLNCSYS